MNAIKNAFVLLFSLTALLAIVGFGARAPLAEFRRVDTGEVNRHVALLKSRDAQQKAAAAYWLGSQHASTVTAVNSLAALLGDKTEVDSSRYRESRGESAARHPRRITVGEEAAAALVKIGLPAADALIQVLTSSPDSHARKNAAWALGAIREGSTGDAPSDEPTNQTRDLHASGAMVA